MPNSCKGPLTSQWVCSSAIPVVPSKFLLASHYDDVPWIGRLRPSHSIRPWYSFSRSWTPLALKYSWAYGQPAISAVHRLVEAAARRNPRVQLTAALSCHRVHRTYVIVGLFRAFTKFQPISSYLCPESSLPAPQAYSTDMVSHGVEASRRPATAGSTIPGRSGLCSSPWSLRTRSQWPDNGLVPRPMVRAAGNQILHGQGLGVYMLHGVLAVYIQAARGMEILFRLLIL